MKNGRFVQDDYSTTAHSLDDYYDAGGTGKTVDKASGKLAHETKRAGRGRAIQKFILFPELGPQKKTKQREKKPKDYTAILEMLPASYDQIAQRLGVASETAQKYITQMRKDGHNIRATGKCPDFVLELISPPVVLAAPKLRSWQVDA